MDYKEIIFIYYTYMSKPPTSDKTIIIWINQMPVFSCRLDVLLWFKHFGHTIKERK